MIYPEYKKLKDYHDIFKHTYLLSKDILDPGIQIPKELSLREADDERALSSLIQSHGSRTDSQQHGTLKETQNKTPLAPRNEQKKRANSDCTSDKNFPHYMDSQRCRRCAATRASQHTPPPRAPVISSMGPNCLPLFLAANPRCINESWIRFPCVRLVLPGVL